MESYEEFNNRIRAPIIYINLILAFALAPPVLKSNYLVRDQHPSFFVAPLLLSLNDYLFTIQGADKFVYAPKPIDVGRLLEADIISNGQKVSLTTTAPIDLASGLGSYVETLFRKSSIEFSVVIAQMNGRNYSSRSAHCFHVGKTKLKLGKGWITKARDSYSGSMQLCGYRGGGNSAAKSLFWLPRKGHSFVLVFESEKERNGALMAARKYSMDCNVILAGPDDDALL